MLLKNIALGLVERFSGLDRFPASDRGLDELVKAMIEAPDHHVAERFVAHWLKTRKFCPKPCDIHQEFEPLRKPRYQDFKALPPLAPGQEPAPAEYFCNQCEDSGWYIVTMAQKISETGQNYTAAKRCSHPPSATGKRKR